MSAKLSNLSELSNILSKKNKTAEGARLFQTVQNRAAITVIFGDEKAAPLLHKICVSLHQNSHNIDKILLAFLPY